MNAHFLPTGVAGNALLSGHDRRSPAHAFIRDAPGGGMSEIKQFSALVGDIYDASLDPSLWTGGRALISLLIQSVEASQGARAYPASTA